MFSRLNKPGHVFLVPLILALISIVGLLSALIADGWGDRLSWLSLGLPVGLCLWYPLRHYSPDKISD